jgi:tight adherence protein C
MTTTHILFLGAVFLAVTGLALGAVHLLAPSPERQRLRSISGRSGRGRVAADAWIAKVARLSQPLVKLSVPEGQWDASPFRLRFIHAGLRNPVIPAVFFGAKTVLAIIFPLVAYFSVMLTGSSLGMEGHLLVLLGSASFGYYLPHVVLGRLMFVRQREILETFPDALDLLIVCVEAGLAIDAALTRVAGEIQHKSVALSEELHLVTLELRAGASKELAFRNLALRTGVEDVHTLVAMLIQAERFGTSIADSLRVHADMLRTKRRQRAEEAAAKIALKLLFPLIFCIFPSLLLVLLGPAFIQIYRILLPSMAGAQ